jgi:solute carrier family 30 (zinc transporter), member 1
MMQIPGIDSVHELHIWRVNENKTVVSAHVVMADDDLASFMGRAQIVRQCLHAYGLQSATLEPEFPPKTVAEESKKAGVLVKCQAVCSAECESLGCCGGSPVIPGV